MLGMENFWVRVTQRGHQSCCKSALDQGRVGPGTDSPRTIGSHPRDSLWPPQSQEQLELVKGLPPGVELVTFPAQGSEFSIDLGKSLSFFHLPLFVPLHCFPCVSCSSLPPPSQCLIRMRPGMLAKRITVSSTHTL